MQNSKQKDLAYNASSPPIVNSIWDFSAEALTQLASWMAQSLPSSIPIAQLQGYGQLTTALRMVTGRIPASGTTPTAGTGFTYTHTNSSGVYVFTFTTPFSAAPTIAFGLNGTTHNATPNISSRSANGFTVTWASTSGSVVDVAFDFIAATTA